MSLDEEIALYQFAQGVQSETVLLDRYNQLEGGKKTRWFLGVNSLVRELKPLDADMQQAMTDSLLTDRDVSAVFPMTDQLKIAIHTIIQHPEGDNVKPYTLLLYVFRAAYQRHFPLGNPANWRYWDLSNSDVVQDIQTRYQAALEEVYTNPSFRSEFACIAKLWHERSTLLKAQRNDPAPEPLNQFTFLSYDEMLTESIKAFSDKQTHGIGVLRHSLEKALSVQYGLDADEIKRVILEVVERHLRETYHTDLFE